VRDDGERVTEGERDGYGEEKCEKRIARGGGRVEKNSKSSFV